MVALVETRWASLNQRADAMEIYTCIKINFRHAEANDIWFSSPPKVSISCGMKLFL